MSIAHNARRAVESLLFFVFFVAPPVAHAQEAPPPQSQGPVEEYHYEPILGKLVGILPDVWDLDRLLELRLHYGFSGTITTTAFGQYELSMQAGFTPESTMVAIGGPGFVWAIDTFPAGYYYIDEPAEHDCAGQASGERLFEPSELAARYAYVHQRRPGSAFVLSCYKRCSHSIIAASYADMMMYAAYTNWNKIGIPVCHVNLGWGDEWEAPWTPGGDDQRDSWSDMRTRFGWRFAMAWVDGRGDEYDILLGHARNLGLQGVWLFSLGPLDPANLEAFCSAAARQGWLRLVEGPPLPVQLASLEAAFVPGKGVLLRWSTVTETDSYGFHLERRREGDPTYATILGGFVPSHGTSLVPHTYEYIDAQAAPGTWWYRLVMVDRDGSSRGSEAVAVDVVTSVDRDALPTRTALYQNYPNPFNPQTTIRFELEQSASIVLTLCDAVGAEVASLARGPYTAGTHEVTFDASSFSSGVYFLRLRDGRTMHSRKIVVLR